MSDLVGDYRGNPRTCSGRGVPAGLQRRRRAPGRRSTRRRHPLRHGHRRRRSAPHRPRPGDVAIVYGDGRIEGFVGGECAEASVRLQAASRPRRSSARPAAHRAGGGSHRGPRRRRAGHRHRAQPVLVRRFARISSSRKSPRPHRRVPHRPPRLGGAAPRPALLDTATTGGATTDDLVNGAAAVVVALPRTRGGGRPHERRAGGCSLCRTRRFPQARRRRAGAARSAAAAAARIHTPAGLDLGAHGAAGDRRVNPRRDRRLPPPGRRRRRDDAPAAEAAAPTAMAPTAVDPVCGMAAADVAGSLFADHDAKRYLFCGSGCRDAFLADPEGFLARS